jgi:hypothetical protein
MPRIHLHRGCRIKRQHGPQGLAWFARAQGSKMVLAMEPTLKAAEAELDRLWAKGVRWFLGERYAPETCESCAAPLRLCDWCDAGARHFLNEELEKGEPSHACDSHVHLLLKIQEHVWDENPDAHEPRLGAYCPNTDCTECDPWN